MAGYLQLKKQNHLIGWFGSHATVVEVHILLIYIFEYPRNPVDVTGLSHLKDLFWERTNALKGRQEISFN